jgi:imidazolonepropionase-like amidohydrolase
MKITTSKTTASILFFISFLTFFISCNKSEIDNRTKVIKDVNVISMCNDSILYGHSVLVMDGKIADIGIFAEMKIPKDAQIINGKEQYLIPGLCDMHVHFNDDDDRILYIANGVTLIRNMSGDPYHLKVRKKINEKCLIGPEIYTTGPYIDGLNPVWPGSVIISDKDKVIEALSQMKNDGYDAIKVYETLTKEVYDEIIRVAKKLEMPVVGHVPQSLDLKEVLFSGQSSIEHLKGYEKYFSDEQIIAETVKSGIWNCPTLMCDKNCENLNYIKKNSPIEIKYVSPNQVYNWENWNPVNLGFVMNMKLLNTLTNNNANIVLGTDVGTPYVVAGFSLHEELSLRQDAGLTPYQILLSATRNCAEMLGYESRLGTIEKNKDADLVLLKNNPLENIKNTKSIVGVMAKGSWYSKEDLNSMLEIVAVKKNSLMQKSTIRNNVFMKLIVLILTLTFLSAFLTRPILYVFNRNKLKSLISDNVHITKYRIRFLVISISIISLIYLFLVASLPEAAIKSGLPTTLMGWPNYVKYLALLPFVNLIILIPLLIFYTIALLRNYFSTYWKWHTLLIISASIISLVLCNYWGFIKLYI